MKKYDKLLSLILPLVTVVCILLLWAFGAYLTDNEYLLPSVGATVKEFFALFINGRFYTALAFTLLRSIVAFVISFLIAFFLAYLTSKSKSAEKLILPIISIIRALPTLAIVLLVLVWTNNQIAPIVVTSLVVMPTAYTQIKSALDSVDKTSVEAGMVDGTDKKTSFLFAFCRNPESKNISFYYNFTKIYPCSCFRNVLGYIRNNNYCII